MRPIHTLIAVVIVAGIASAQVGEYRKTTPGLPPIAAALAIVPENNPVHG